MWGRFKSYLENTVYWLVLIGTLAFLHVVDSKLFDLPEAVTSFADGVPRIVYPFFYGVIGLYVLRPFHWKIRQPRKLALILGVLLLILVALVKFADLPPVGFMNLQYLVAFLLIVLSGFIAASASAVMAAHETEKASAPETGTLKGGVPSGTLNTGLSWMWRRNDDHRNRELMVVARFWIKLLLLIFICIYLFIGWLDLSDQKSPGGWDLMRVAIYTVISWGCFIYALVSANRKSWAPNIDADRKLRKAFGAKYDAQLDRELETKSLKKLFGEDWFIRMFEQLMEPAAPANRPSADQ